MEASDTFMLDLVGAFGIEAGEIISLVGAGGKTTLMYNLAKELTRRYSHVITTTTTKIRRPNSTESPHVLLLSPEERIPSSLSKALENYRHITLAANSLPGGKLKGLKPETINELRQLLPDVPIIIEADGAAQKSLKAPADWEPVIPETTSLMIPVVGLDVLGKELMEGHVFRAQLAAGLLQVRLGEIITEDHIASLITHPLGIIKGSPAGARIIPFFNKVELLSDLNQAKSLAEKVLASHHPRIKQIILGNARSSHPVATIINAL